MPRVQSRRITRGERKISCSVCLYKASCIHKLSVPSWRRHEGRVGERAHWLAMVAVTLCKMEGVDYVLSENTAKMCLVFFFLSCVQGQIKCPQTVQVSFEFMASRLFWCSLSTAFILQ